MAVSVKTTATYNGPFSDWQSAPQTVCGPRRFVSAAAAEASSCLATQTSDESHQSCMHEWLNV